MSNKIETKTYMSNEWIRNIKLKIKKFEKYNKNRSNLYKILNYNEEELIKIELKMIQSIRILYLYVNKTKYDIFNYDTLRLWKIVSKKKNYFIENIINFSKDKKFNNEQKKYILLTLKTLQKYDDKYGLFIACVINRLFCYDISQQILNFI
jgi:hypothetical protein